MHIKSNRADILLSSRQKTSAIQEPPGLHRQKSPRQNPCNQHLQICNKTNNFIHPQNEHLHKNHRRPIPGISTSSASRTQIRSARPSFGQQPAPCPLGVFNLAIS
jgi:hypothetical protein